MPIVITITPEERERIAALFWSKVKRGGVDECWPWQGEADRKGYGRFCIRRRRCRAARVAYVLTHGEQPGEAVLHACDNPPCCNPAHLRSGTLLENVEDMDAKGRRVMSSSFAQPGTQNRNAKLTPADIPRIKALRKSGLSLREVGREFGVTRFAVSKIMRGITWKQES